MSFGAARHYGRNAGGWKDNLPRLFAAVVSLPLIIIGMALVAGILVFGLDIPGHNQRLRRLEQHVKRDLAHPTDSRLILRRNVVENLNGTGNGCTFAVVELRRGGGSPELRRQFYGSLRLKDPDTGAPLSPVLRTDLVAPDTVMGAQDPITRLTTLEERKGADYAVAVSSWSEPGCDFRCE